MRVPENAVSFSRCWRLLWIVALMLFVGLAYAQDESSQGDAGDPPARVARLSYASGDLGLMPAGSTEWSAADVNRPLTNGDKLSSGADSRAELELGGASLRLSGQSDIGVLNLNADIGQFELTQGTVSLTVRSLDEGSSYEIDTPTLALVISQPGTFRIDVPTDGSSTTVTVFDGGATVYGENHAQREVFSGRSYQFANASLNNVMVSDIEGRDAFDAWCSERDAQYASANQVDYVPDAVVGAQDLNQYGDWQVDDDYGPVWYPDNVVAGWAPYRFGHWVWIAPWGWTWVDGLPWGFAPYHYGRWIFVRGRWGWIPGPPHVRPIYAPALVAFVGLGAGGPVGWFPLGPHEVYNPWYRASRRYYTNVNLTNIAIGRRYNRATVIGHINGQYNFYRAGRPITGVTYANRNLPHAFTAVSAQAFASARNVQSNQMRLTPRQMAVAPVAASAVPQRPSTASFGRPRSVNARPLPAAGFNRPVVAARAPAPAARAEAGLHTNQPASHVRVLDLGVRGSPAPSIVSGHAMPQTQRLPQTPSRATAPPTLPRVPHFESAQQIHPVESSPRYAQPQPQARPNPSEEERLRQEPVNEQQRFNAAERSHEYVPEQPRTYMPAQRAPISNPSYHPTPYRYEQAQPYAHPPAGHPEQAAHPQSAPHPHGYAPPAKNDNQH